VVAALRVTQGMAARVLPIVPALLALAAAAAVAVVAVAVFLLAVQHILGKAATAVVLAFLGRERMARGVPLAVPVHKAAMAVLGQAVLGAKLPVAAVAAGIDLIVVSASTLHITMDATQQLVLSALCGPVRHAPFRQQMLAPHNQDHKTWNTQNLNFTSKSATDSRMSIRSLRTTSAQHSLTWTQRTCQTRFLSSFASMPLCLTHMRCTRASAISG
jgi:hypothetical protein